MTERVIPLLRPEIDTPPLSTELLRRFTGESLLLSPVMDFHPHRVKKMLREKDLTYMAVDMGGDKITARAVRLNHGVLEPVGEDSVLQSKDGIGYLDFLKDVADVAQRKHLPVGMSFAGPIRDEVPEDAPNMKQFFEALEKDYGGNIKVIVPQLVAVQNDAIAAILSGSLAAIESHPNLKNVLLLILGGGLGAAALTNGTIQATEAGHLEVVESLNPFRVTNPCTLAQKLLNQNYTCLENVAGGVAGIEATAKGIWGLNMTGPEINRLMLGGDKDALRLYNNAAAVVSHIVVGLMRLLNIPSNPEETAVLLHGGVYKVPGFAQRQERITAEYLNGVPLPTIKTSELVSDNACLEGAAIAAFLARNT